MHIDAQLTRNIEIGALRIQSQDALEVIRQDNLLEVRNSRVDAEPRQWEVSLPICDIDNDRADFDSVRLMWSATERGLHTFNFYDFVEEEVVKVRFGSPLQITAPAGHLRHVDTFTLIECAE